MTVNKDKADLVLSSILTIPLLKMSVGTTAIMDVVNIRPKGWKAYVQGLYLLRYIAFSIFFTLALECICTHGLRRTPNEGINQINLKIRADVADKI